MGDEFIDGELFEHVVSTSQGDVGLIAEIVIRGTELWLVDLVVEPIRNVRLNIGAGEVLLARRELSDMARNAGFETLRITAIRLTGANPGQTVDVTINLTK